MGPGQCADVTLSSGSFPFFLSGLKPLLRDEGLSPLPRTCTCRILPLCRMSIPTSRPSFTGPGSPSIIHSYAARFNHMTRSSFSKECLSL